MLTLLTKTGCSHSGFSGVFVIFMSYISPARALSDSRGQYRHSLGGARNSLGPDRWGLYLNPFLWQFPHCLRHRGLLYREMS